MKCENQMELTFPSQSRNEGFARAAVAAFAAGAAATVKRGVDLFASESV